MGKSPLAAMNPFRVRRWFTRELPLLAQLIADTFQLRDEITSGGGSFAAGTITTTTIPVGADAMSSVLGGLLMSDTAALSASDLLAAAGSVGAAIYSDGSAYTGDPITMAGGEQVPITVVLTNSDNTGGAVGDDGAPLLVAVVPGTDPASAKAAGTTPSSVEVEAALAASTEHAGVTAWAHYVHVLWEGTGPAITPTLNRNNAVLGI